MYVCLYEILSSCLVTGEFSHPPVVNPDQGNRDDQTEELQHLLVTSQESDQSDHVDESWVLSPVSADWEWQLDMSTPRKLSSDIWL